MAGQVYTEDGATRGWGPHRGLGAQTQLLVRHNPQPVAVKHASIDRDLVS